MGKAEPEKNFIQWSLDWVFSWKEPFEWLRQRIGLPLTIVVSLSVAAIVASGLVWWEWDDIVKRPGVHWLVAHYNQKPILPAPTGHLTIAVVHLEDDKDREQEKLLLDGLSHDFVEVDTLPVDRIVEWPDSGTEQARKKEAEANARDLLKKTGADVLIWGSVISLGGKSAMRLFWTPSREVSGAASNGKYLPQTESIALPEAFWTDLKQILGLLTQTRLVELTNGQEGHYIADQLAPLITQVRVLVESKEGIGTQKPWQECGSALLSRSKTMASSQERMNRLPKAANFIAKCWTNGPASGFRSTGP